MFLIFSLSLTLLSLPMGFYGQTTDPAMSITGMKGLVDMEGFLIGELTNFAKALKSKILKIESFLQDVQSKREISRKNPEEFVAHPLNGFSLIRRLHEDWTQMEFSMSERVGLDHIQAIQKGLEEGKPTDKDLNDAIGGMLLLERFYNIQPVDIAKGLFMGHKYNTTLTPLNCLVLANAFMNFNIERVALNWHQTAIATYDEDRDGQVYREVFDFKLSDLYENYTSALVLKGSYKEALKILRNVSDLDPKLWILQRKVYEMSKLGDENRKYIGSWVDRSGCQAQWAIRKYFSCHYERGTSDFLRIAPLKVEVLSVEPEIVIYHDVIYDGEISRIKNISLPSLKATPRYINRDDYNIKLANFHEDYQSPLNRRIMDMTGEDVKEDTDFLVNSYGICGFRDYHTDNINFPDQTAELGDRLTSITFFISDVALGGAIVFNNLNLTIRPQKGSAVVWKNLNNEMQPNEDLWHLSCPVVVGSKWTLVKWLHERPHMFSTPCKKELKKFNI
ncbi:prolyl 4-hydroxylase subunit alpha-1 [Drosophila eugracilis]|uniref:prolyl 4-hydroxylase subunit alpha-1 n=1 Tax=Drosophila eugracilis TaxID=29029 RepID=UPI0007E8387B|nr:prolyl 4-hydroxylase subunit alpha-1 [Drosophila eugracilis]